MPRRHHRRPPQESAFAAVIRAARIEADLTQADLAERAGLPLWLLQQAERGRPGVRLFEAAALARALGRSLDELVKVGETTFEPPKKGADAAC